MGIQILVFWQMKTLYTDLNNVKFVFPWSKKLPFNNKYMFHLQIKIFSVQITHRLFQHPLVKHYLLFHLQTTLYAERFWFVLLVIPMKIWAHTQYISAIRNKWQHFVFMHIFPNKHYVLCTFCTHKDVHMLLLSLFHLQTTLWMWRRIFVRQTDYDFS